MLCCVVVCDYSIMQIQILKLEKNDVKIENHDISKMGSDLSRFEDVPFRMGRKVIK